MKIVSIILLIVCLANLGILVQAGVSSPPDEFTVEINRNSHWIIRGSYYPNPASSKLVLFIGGGTLFGGNYAIIGLPSAGIPDSVFTNLQGSGFNVATIRFGTFASWKSIEINTLLAYLTTTYGVFTTVSLVGFSAGGMIVASYLVDKGSWNVDRAVILDAPLDSIDSSNLMTPTLLLYGSDDSIAPVKQSTYAWLANAPPNIVRLEVYPYEHNPWGSPHSLTRTVEARLIAHLAGSIPVPEQSNAAAILMVMLLLVAMASKKYYLHPHMSLTK